MMLLDVPITSSEQDAFGRKKAAERCARRLSDIRSDTAFVVGLSGDWGSGKTSFVNMVKEALGNSDEKTTVVDFNAWLYSSQEQLVRQFFSEVSRAVEKNAAKNVGSVAAKELGNTLSEYSEAISEAGTNLAGALIPQLLVLNKTIPAASTAQKYVWKRVLQRASDALKGGDKTIEQLREEVSKSLSKLDGNIVVVIDDVDRLPQEDIRALFKLVNLTASFPRMTYLLSYDGSVVRKALAGVQGTDGSDYLDKIVQLPIDLPQPSMDVLRSKLEEVIGPYVNVSGFELDRSERTRLLRVFDSFVMRSIRTPRQVKRYLNRLEVMRDDVENEICPVDVIGMTGIFLFHPVLANWIWEWRDDICTSDRVLTSLDMRISDQTIDALVSEAFPDADEAAMLLDALPTLFPDLTYVLGDHNYRRMHIGRETGRVAHLDNLELVYATADGVEVRRDELLGLATEASADDLKRNILKLDRRGQLNRLIETMEMRRPNLSNDRKATICGAFLDTLGSLKQDEAHTVLSKTAIESASMLLQDFLRDIGTAAADAIVMASVGAYGFDDYLGISNLLRQEMAAWNAGVPQPCLSEHCYHELEKAYIDAMVSNYLKVLCLPEHLACTLWEYLDEPLVDGARERIRERYSGELPARVMYASSKLKWRDGAETLECRCEFSDEALSGWVLQVPCAHETVEFAKTAKFHALNEGVKLRIAALFLLLSDYELDPTAGEKRVVASRALEQLEEWET